MRAGGREIRNNCAEPGPAQAPFLKVPSCGSRVSDATGPGELAGPAKSAMPRKRRLAVKASPVAMGQKRESVRGPKGAGNSPFSCAQLQPLTKIAPALLWKPI